MANAISAQIKLDGGKTFANEFKNAASAVKAANSELSYLDKELSKNSNNTDLLAKRTAAAEKAFRAEQDQIDLLTSRMEELNNMTGVDTTQAMNELTSEVYKHKQAQASLGDTLDESGEDFKDFAQDIAVAQVAMTEIVNIAKKVATAVWNVGKEAVEYNAEMEGYSKTIQAFFKTAGQSSEEALKNTEDLIANQKELSMQTGVGTDKLIEANKMLIAAGMNGETSQKAISALTKAVVATGGGNQELSRMAQNLQQIANTGKASSMDMKQFAMAGVDVYGLMADATGKTVEELQEMDVTFDMIVEALDYATQEGGKFFEASQVGASTLNGQMSTLESTIKDKLGTAFEPVNEALVNDVIPAAMELVEEIDWERLGDAIADAVLIATKALEILVESIEWVLDKAEGWSDAYQEVSEDLSGTERAHNSLARGILADAGLIDKDSTVVTNALTDAAASMQNFMETAHNSANGLADLADDGYTWGTHMMEGFANGIGDNTYLVGTAAAKAANAVAAVMEFTRPDEGPLHDYEIWMPHMMQGFAKGIEDNIWRVSDAASAAAGAIAGPMAVTNNISMTVNGAQGQSAQDIADVVMLRIQQATNRRSAVWA